jgi:uncharacterized protein (DUF2126 family)
VLPIQRWNADAGRWKSQRWKLRRGNLILTPGDSPLGYRLPLSSLPHIPVDQYPYIVEQDPLEPREELPVFETLAAESPPHQGVQEQKLELSGGVRTAMSVEIRDGVLCAFMPPVERLEDYLELVSAVEATAEEMQIKVHVEGYPPPFDPRLEVIKVTGARRSISRWASTKMPQRCDWGPIAFYSMAAIAGPAVAIMWWSAAPRPRTRRSSAVRIS